MKKTYISLLLAAIFCMIFSQEADAQHRNYKKKQQNRFNAGVVLGTNLSQIDGDLYTGFNKIGIRGGLEGTIYLNKYFDVVAGLLFVQKGSRTNSNVTFASDIPPNTEIKLDYMEVPFLLSVKLGSKSQTGYTLEAGFSYARLINSQINTTEFPDKVSYSDLLDKFNSNEINVIFAFNFLFSKRFDIGILTEFQLNKLYKANINTDVGSVNSPNLPTIDFMRNYLIGIQFGYKFL
jgi:hypothetical protein